MTVIRGGLRFLIIDLFCSHFYLLCIYYLFQESTTDYNIVFMISPISLCIAVPLRLCISKFCRMILYHDEENVDWGEVKSFGEDPG